MTARVDFTTPLPRQLRRWSFVGAFFALAPLVLWTSMTRSQSPIAPLYVPVHELLGGVTWSLWEPGRFLARTQTLALEWSGAGTRAAPLVGLLLGSLVLMLATVPPSTARTSPKRRLAAGALLGLVPGYLLAVTMGAPILWGLGAWAVVVRAMGPCEGRENIQQEMSIAFGLSLLMLAEPMAWLLIGPALLGMPLLLRRPRHRATAAAMALCTIPPMMMVAAVVLALTILTESSPLPHLLRWMHAIGSIDPVVPLIVVGPSITNVLVLVSVPTLVLGVIALRDRRRRYHPMTFAIAAVAPTLCMLALALAGHEDTARILALYAVAGQAMWLAQTPLPRARFRWGIAVALLGLIGQYLL